MPETIKTKRCCACKEIKLISEFYKNRCMKDGLSHYCKPCFISYEQRPNREAAKAVDRKKYKKSDKGKIVESRYAKSKKGKSAMIKGIKKYNQANPKKKKAHIAVGIAVAKGELPRIKTLICDCGKQAEQRHHHKGYAKKHWLDVIPKCIKCHKKIHNQ